MDKNSIKEMRERFLKAPSASIYDVLDGMGYPGQCIDLGIKPVTSCTHIAGPAFTVKGHREPLCDNDYKRPKFDDFGQFKAMYENCIVVINAESDRLCGHWGEMMSYSARQYGAKGVVVDGGTRDRDGLMAIPDWPVFARYTSPIESKKRWRSDDLEIPIYLTGTLTSQVRVNPGDWVVGDNDGVMIIPKDIAGEVLIKVEEVEAKEEGTRTDLAAGMPVPEVYKKYGRM